MTFQHDAHGLVSASRTESDLSDGDTAGAQCVSQGSCVPLGIGQLDNGHNAYGADLLLKFIHCYIPPDIANCICLLWAKYRSIL
jgi:hypothetical protein